MTTLNRSELHPHRRVGLVTFNSEVHIIGDGTQPVVHLGGDRLSNYADLTAVAGEHVGQLTQPISATAKVSYVSY